MKSESGKIGGNGRLLSLRSASSLKGRSGKLEGLEK